MIAELIDKQDNSEIIRDRIAEILAAETANQQAHAVTLARDPKLWAFRVVVERSNPVEDYLNNKQNTTPVINVWYDSSTFDDRSSTAIERQTANGTFNIDCYAVGYASDNGDGQIAGDEAAAREVQRVVKIVRNIIMSDIYTYLGLRGVVGKRWPASVTIFQPPKDSNYVQNVVGARLALTVTYNEFSPQVQPVTLEQINFECYRAENGELISNLIFNYEG